MIVEKYKYLGGVESCAARPIAGVPTTVGPVRAWAMAPIGGRRCRLDSSDGSRGVIPMHPLVADACGLADWVTDVADYARAWAR